MIPEVSHWIECPARDHGRHWGAFGAAGVAVFTTVNSNLFTLLALRSGGVQGGACWSGTIGGAIEEGETPWQAAQREASEEVTGLELGTSPGSVIWTCGCGWQYTTFVTMVETTDDMLPSIAVARGPSSWETDAVVWQRAEDVKFNPDLHARFAQAFGMLRELAEK
jgi:8-oxo-dGTP diphosphatase